MNMTVEAPAGQAPAPEKGRFLSFDNLPYYLVPGCIFFNFFLCYVNTRVHDVSVTMVVLSEIILIGLSVYAGFLKIDRVKLFWLMVMGIQIVLLMLLSVAKEELLMKPIRDVIIMPIFIVLGLSAWRLNTTKMLFWLTGIIFVITLFEGFYLAEFIDYFNIMKYYIGKGGLPEDFVSPWALSASGMRPNERFLMDLPFHRVSSVFLEPVSLGFYGFITGLYFVAVKKDVKRVTYVTGLVFAYLLIWFSDARMAFGTLSLMILARPLLAMLDHRLSALIFPAILVVSSMIYISGIFGTMGEGIGWRINDTMSKLSVMDLDLLLGVTTHRLHAEDSGLLKILQFHGLFGFMLYWLAPIFFMRRMPEAPKIYLFGLTMFLAFGFMISAAILTIKTAALLWFLYGYLIAKYVNTEAAENHDNIDPARS